MEKFKLPSGAKLEVTMGSFRESKELYQAFLGEAIPLKFDDQAEIDVNIMKDMLCVALSSKKIEEALSDCMGRALYNKHKIDDDTFENEKSREDYFHVCFYVAKVNILPFVKGLYAEYYPKVMDLLRKNSQA